MPIKTVRSNNQIENFKCTYFYYSLLLMYKLEFQFIKLRLIVFVLLIFLLFQAYHQLQSNNNQNNVKRYAQYAIAHSKV